MLVNDVLRKFNKLVPFPITAKKIEDAGFDVDQYIKDMGEALRQCDDVGDQPRVRSVCRLLEKGAK